MNQVITKQYQCQFQIDFPLTATIPTTLLERLNTLIGNKGENANLYTNCVSKNSLFLLEIGFGCQNTETITTLVLDWQGLIIELSSMHSPSSY